MASFQVSLEHISDDEESDVNKSPHNFFEQPRISGLATSVPIPDSFDMPVSEGNEEVPPEVDMINSLISAPSSSGKLTRPKPSKLASNLLQRRMHTDIRPNVFDMTVSPKRVPSLRPRGHRMISQNDPQDRPGKRRKRNHRVGLEAEDHDRNSARKPSAPPARKQHGRQLRSGDVASLSLPVSTSSRKTRSAANVTHQQLDLSRRLSRRHIVPAEQSNAAPEELQPVIQPQNEDEEAGRPDKTKQFPIEDSSSAKLSSQSAGSGNHSTSPQTVVQERSPIQESSIHLIPPPSEQHHASPVHSLEREVSPLPQAVDVPPTAVDETQREQSPDSASFLTAESAPRSAQSAAKTVEQERRLEELFNEYGSDNYEDCHDEVSVSEDVHIPEQLDEALKFAHDLDEAANDDFLSEEFDGINILKSYSRLKRTVHRWKSANDYSKTGDSLKLSNDILKEAKTILEKPDWYGERGHKHICGRVLPSLVRMLYLLLVYHLSEAGTMKRLSYESLKGCRNITKTVINISEKVDPKNTTKKLGRPQDVIRMVARIKNVHKTLEKRSRMLKLVKDAADDAQRQKSRREQQQAADLEAEAENARRRQSQRERLQAAEIEREAEHAQRQQTQRERQQAAALEAEDELKIRTWREQWRVLHDQRFGAELEGQFCLPPDKERHLRHIPAENTSVEYPYWDKNFHVPFLYEGLKNCTGPDVYRKIFRKYCCQGGPLRDFNVSEIVDKAVSLRDCLIKITVEDGEDQEQWVLDIPDPRKPPVALR